MESNSSTSGRVVQFFLVSLREDANCKRLTLFLVAILLLLVHPAEVLDKPADFTMDVSSQKQRNVIHIVVQPCDEVGMCW